MFSPSPGRNILNLKHVRFRTSVARYNSTKNSYHPIRTYYIVSWWYY